MNAGTQRQLPFDDGTGPCAKPTTASAAASRNLAVDAVDEIPIVGRPVAANRTPMLLIVHDVEAELQLGRTRTYELIRSGEIPVVRIGRAVRVPREALRRWIDDQCIAAVGGNDDQ